MSPAVRAQAREAAAGVDCGVVSRQVEELVAAADRESPDAEVMEEFGLPHRRQGARDWLLDNLGEGLTVQSVDDRHVPVENLVLTLPGSGAGPGDAPAGELVQLTAHYDTWFTGADDNASGVSTAAHLVTVLQALDHSRTIQVIFYDMEETGLDGSLAWWQGRGGERVHSVLNLDAIAFTGPQSAPPGFRLPARGDYIVGLGNGPARHHLRWLAELSGEIPQSASLQGIFGPSSNDHPATSDFHRSDHSPAWQAGVPGVFLTDTANLRNPHYHQASDLPSTLDPAFHCGVSRLVAGAVAAFAEMP
jgi:hypothetical protein